jgi:hypothetical protein
LIDAVAFCWIKSGPSIVSQLTDRQVGDRIYWRHIMKLIKTAAATAILAISTAATAAMPILYEEARAREEEQLIFTTPIAGIENNLWFDYRIDVTEAQKELTSDLRRASDTEDLRDAWEEYGTELAHERKDYIHDMGKRGYRKGTVQVGN